MISLVGLFAACLLAIVGDASAEIYSCREGGSTVIRSTPCAGDILPQVAPPSIQSARSQSAQFVTSANVSKISGTVVSIADGDTITVLDSDRQQHKIRLAGIDAPEKKQPFGERSKQNLAAMVFNKSVTIEWEKQDRYGRTVGKVLINGTDANLEQIKAGLAWWYEKYRNEQSLEDQRRYAEAEQQARRQKVGLWVDATPMEPWNWRHCAPQCAKLK